MRKIMVGWLVACASPAEAPVDGPGAPMPEPNLAPYLEDAQFEMDEDTTLEAAVPAIDPEGAELDFVTLREPDHGA
ncbi:MAG: hypothetical protein AAF211_34065, partial [Myxococcota bacterium]